MHSFLDKHSVVMSSLVLKNQKWFQKSVDSATFREHFDNIDLKLPNIKGEGFYEVDGTSLIGKVDPAFHIVKWLGFEYPTIIYHHGNNERPFDYRMGSKNTFKSVILAKEKLFKANIINVRAPFHNNGMKFYLEKISNLSDFTTMLAVSVNLIEKLVQYLKYSGCEKILVSGISLGGWVTNLHRSYYNSASVYIPIFAGAALDELFLTSYYKKLTGDLAKKNPEMIKRILNFEREFSLIEDKNVFPLLARFDKIIEFHKQKQCYSDECISVIDKGHITGALASNKLRNHILTYINY